MLFAQGQSYIIQLSREMLFLSFYPWIMIWVSPNNDQIQELIKSQNCAYLKKKTSQPWTLKLQYFQGATIAEQHTKTKILDIKKHKTNKNEH
jgi:hypothetical protein